MNSQLLLAALNYQLLAEMSDAGMIRIVVRLVIFACIVAALWWLIDYCVSHPMLNKGLHIVLAILAVLWFCRELLNLGV